MEKTNMKQAFKELHKVYKIAFTEDEIIALYAFIGGSTNSDFLSLICYGVDKKRAAQAKENYEKYKKKNIDLMLKIYNRFRKVVEEELETTKEYQKPRKKKKLIIDNKPFMRKIVM